MRRTKAAMPALKGAMMAEDDTPKWADEDEAPPLVVPSHDPLPPPPDIQFTRPDQKRIHQQRVTPGVSRPLASQPQKAEPQTEAGENLGSSAVKLGSGLAAATTFTASVIAGFLIGQWIDHRWNHSGGLPWGTLVFSLAGVAAGFLNLFRVLSATDRSDTKK
jgi:F0F1-type ATP synthase assembly protein I